VGESLILSGGPFQTVGAKQLNNLLPNSVENGGTSRKDWYDQPRLLMALSPIYLASEMYSTAFC